MMIIEEASKQLARQLSTIYDSREANNIASLVIEHITKLPRIERILDAQKLLTNAQIEQLTKYTAQLLQNIPVQYVIEEAWFGGLPFFVNKAVLIPRPETEELVDWILTDVKQSNIYYSAIRLIDIGTGSGCIPIKLKKNLSESEVTAIDISEKALEVASRNAIKHQVAIQFIQTDFLEERNWLSIDKQDIIISNPPYIKRSEKAEMNKNVTEHEPALALFVSDSDPLLFYRKIALFAKEYLTEKGCIYLEINEALGAETVALFNQYNYTAELRKDLQGKDRMIKAWKNG